MAHQNVRGMVRSKDKENFKEHPNISELSPIQKENVQRYVREKERRVTRNQLPQKNSIDNKDSEKPCVLSIRDPKRRPLQNRSPFAPFSRGAPSATELQLTSDKHIIPNNRSTKNSLYPGYVSINKDGLLQISKHPPRAVDITIGSAEKVSGILPIFPMTFNGGSMGIYSDPNEFGKGGVNATSQNGHDQMRVPRSYISFPHNFEQGTYSDEKIKPESRSARFRNTADQKDDESNKTLEENIKRILRYKTSRNEKGERVINVWDTWHRILNFVSSYREKHAVNDIIRTLPTNKMKQRARLSSAYNEDDYDFAIVLQSKEVYSFWAEILDFREENGYRVKTHSDYLLSGTEMANPDQAINLKKRGSDMIETDDFSATSSDESAVWGQDIDTNKRFSIGSISPTRKIYKSKSVNDYGQFVFTKGKSLFDRAVEGDLSPENGNDGEAASPYRTVARKIRKSLSSKFSPNSKRRASEKKSTPSSSRRRWGNKYVGDDSFIRSVMSPPVHALPRLSPKRATNRTRVTYDSDKNESSQKRKKLNENVLEMDEIPNQTVPRGIKARETGLKDFLWAMRNGIVVRKLRRNHDPVYVRLSSSDGGDTIRYEYLYPEDAIIALRQQRQKYNKKNLRGYGDDEDNDHGAWAPLDFDQVKHDDISSKESRGSIGVRKSIEDLVVKKLASGSIKASDIVAVQRATHPDPLTQRRYFDEETQKEEVEYLGDGTPTLRAYKERISSMHEIDSDLLKVDDVRTFSIVLPNSLAFARSKLTLPQLNEKWLQNKASEKEFRFLDFEAATNGEYWILFSGFLWLHRDAINGRFDAQRNKGFGAGSVKNKYEPSDINDCESNNFLMFKEPVEKGCFRRLMSRYAKHVEDETPVTSIRPPPSDYFLGYTSEGTMIWSRLRNAGLETERIYALNTKTVMIKIKCPEDRLMDVAEVLRLKLKTTQGYFAPFKESEKDIFKPSDISCGSRNSLSAHNLFSSAITQHIIDFIINSRIRDSGAGLSGQTALDKGIAIRTPLHKHAKLEALCDLWVFFWKEKNWTSGSRMRSLLMLDDKGGDNSETDSFSGKRSLKPLMKRLLLGCIMPTFDKEEGEYPVLFMRIFVGTFFQPLDSIEEYFGEKVTFYFAWLQHSSFHLIPISILGFVVFLIQVLSGKFDHAVRPYFACILMIWSFYVMCSWRKRQNFLTHRWGSLNHNQDESPRPQFYGDEKVDEVTGEKIMYYPSWKRWMKYMLSFPLTVAFTCSALIGLLMLHANRDLWLARYFADSEKEHLFDINWSLSAIGNKEALGAVELSKAHFQDPKFWYIVSLPPLILGLTLPLLNYILMQISRGLNDFENHMTESQYRNALIAKVIAFRFVAYFAALYYYAYVSTGPNQTIVENGILRVATSLVIFLTVANWWGIFLGIYMPLLILKWRKYRDRLLLRTELRALQVLEQTYTRDRNLTAEEAMHIEKSIINKRILLEQAQSEVWQEMMLPEYNPFFDYIQAVVNFTYVACFSAVMPLTPLLVLINQLINMRLHAFKICRSRRRPLAQKTGGIEVWEHVLHMVTVMAILTNCSLMVLSSSQFRFVRVTHGAIGLFAVIVGWEHIMLIIKYLMQTLISPYSRSVLIKMKKEENKSLRERHQHLQYLRAKSDRRSGSYSNLAPNIMTENEPSVVKETDNESDSLSDHLQSGLRRRSHFGLKESLRREKHEPQVKKYSGSSEYKPVNVREVKASPSRTTVPSKAEKVKIKPKMTSPVPAPLHQYFENELASPLLHRDNSELSLSDMLSIDDSHQGFDDAFKTPIKASMSRARMEQVHATHHKAAEKRIERRLSKDHRKKK